MLSCLVKPVFSPSLAGGEVSYAATDVGRRAYLATLVQLAQARFGGLDVLVSNAGTAPISRLEELRVEDWEAMIDINTKGLLHGIAAAMPVFRQQGGRHFVNVLSVAGLSAILPTMAVYAATKNAPGLNWVLAWLIQLPASSNA